MAHFVLSEIDHEAALEAAGATEPEAGNDRSPMSVDTASPGTSSDSSDSAVAGPEASAVISEPQKPKPKIVARLVDFRLFCLRLDFGDSFVYMLQLGNGEWGI